MKPLTRTQSATVLLPANDIDTDQIIPARFLKTTERTGLGTKLFHDWRGERGPAAMLDQLDPKAYRILVAGDNFGCGSSREHAPWALVDWGFEAVIAMSFADIFRNNALKNGLLPVALPSDVHARLIDLLRGQPDLEVVIDLEAEQVTLPGELGSHRFDIDPFARRRLLAGTDELGYLRGFEVQISAFETARNGTNA